MEDQTKRGRTRRGRPGGGTGRGRLNQENRERKSIQQNARNGRRRLLPHRLGILDRGRGAIRNEEIDEGDQRRRRDPHLRHRPRIGCVVSGTLALGRPPGSVGGGMLEIKGQIAEEGKREERYEEQTESPRVSWTKEVRNLHLLSIRVAGSGQESNRKRITRHRQVACSGLRRACLIECGRSSYHGASMTGFVGSGDVLAEGQVRRNGLPEAHRPKSSVSSAIPSGLVVADKDVLERIFLLVLVPRETGFIIDAGLLASWWYRVWHVLEFKRIVAPPHVDNQVEFHRLESLRGGQSTDSPVSRSFGEGFARSET